MKKIYFCTNTKIVMNTSEILTYLNKLDDLMEDISKDKIDLSIFVPYTVIKTASEQMRSGKMQIGAQNISGEESKELTGEISGELLKEAGAKIVMIAHSERRRREWENPDCVNYKVGTVLKSGLNALLCVGESSLDKHYSVTDDTLSMQLKYGLHNVSHEEIKQLRILYEPEWAIGKYGKEPGEEYIAERLRTIKKTLCKLFGEDASDKIPVLYGGSVNISNAEKLISLDCVDGLGIGRGAFDPECYHAIIRNAMKHNK